MDLYNRDIEKFKENILDRKFTAACIKSMLLSYENNNEACTIEDLIKQLKDTGRDDILERLHNVMEIELIFAHIWSVDERECIRRIVLFDLLIVYGSSFMVEFVKIIKSMCNDVQNIPYDLVIESTAFKNLYGVMAVKYFKSKKKATEYFETFVDNARGIPGINLSETKRQLSRFIELFPN